MSFLEFFSACAILLGLVALTRWTKGKTDPFKHWAYVSLAVAIVGSVSDSVLRYLDGAKYRAIICLVDVGWLGGVAICIGIAVWKAYQDRELRHRKGKLWMGAVCVLAATAAMCYYGYHLLGTEKTAMSGLGTDTKEQSKEQSKGTGVVFQSANTKRTKVVETTPVPWYVVF